MDTIGMLTRRTFLSALILSQAACSRPSGVVLDHGIAFQFIGANQSEIAVTGLDTAGKPAVIVASVGRGSGAAFLERKFDPSPAFQRLGEYHPYTNWRNSGTGLYFRTVAAGASPVAVRVATPPGDEVTLGAVAVGGTRITDFSWTEALVGQPITSLPVRTTGPATLVAFWWGDAGVSHRKVALPNNGFRVIDSVLKPGPLVQSAVAVRKVNKAGTYDVSWRSSPKQGAQLWLVAVE